MIVSVEREHILEGVPCCESNCAISKALRVNVPDFPYQVRVGKEIITVVDNSTGSWATVLLPKEAREFITQFDNLKGAESWRRHSVSSFSFEIEDLPIPFGGDTGTSNELMPKEPAFDYSL